jgi:DNA-binding NarL/FixJ family response regulator
MDLQTDRDIRILIAEKEGINSQLLKNALEHQNAFKIVGCASNTTQILSEVASHAPDILLVRNSLEAPQDGLETVYKLWLRGPRPRSIVLAEGSKPHQVICAFKAGARGVYTGGDDLSSLYRCIRCVDAGQIWINSGDLEVLIEEFIRNSPRVLTGAKGEVLLTGREQELADLVGQGLSNKEISERLKLSEHTVKNYLFRIFDKLGVSSRVELILYLHGQRDRFPGRVA